MRGADEAAALSSWDRLWPLLVTAGLSLSVVFVSQWFVIPYVERRRRREQRWEDHISALGEMLTLDVPTAVKEYGAAILTCIWMRDVPADIDAEQWRREQRQADQVRWRARERCDEVMNRVKWLTDLVVPKSARHEKEGQRFWISIAITSAYSLHAVDATFAGDAVTEDEAREAENELLRRTRDAVERLRALNDAGWPGGRSRSRRWRRSGRRKGIVKPTRTSAAQGD